MHKKHPALIKLGNKIRELRKLKNLSQEAFADEVGLDRTYIGGIERGERNIATLNLMRIAIVLNIEMGQLFQPLEIIKKDLI